MKRILISCFAAFTTFGLAIAGAHADTASTAFTYQGHLVRNGSPVANPNPGCDFEFSLWDDVGGVTQVGVTQTLIGVPVSDGLFTVELNGNDEFGPEAFKGDRRWLKIAVRCPPDASFTTLSPLQPVTAAPYALALGGLYTQQNATSPNVIGGFKDNDVTPGVVGATLSGGGIASPEHNRITDDFGTVGGGQDNQAGDGAGTTTDRRFATVGGGLINLASGFAATIGGGRVNSATVNYATVAGGWGNRAWDFACTVSGGQSNMADGDFAAIGGGSFNTAVGLYATVPGGRDNTAGGDYSFAAGRRAKVRHATLAGNSTGDEGTFVWADSTDADFQSTGNDQFLLRAGGGVGVNKNDPVPGALDVDGPGLFSGALDVDGPGTFGGDVGIGTTSPLSALHVVGAENNGTNAALHIDAGTQTMLIDGNEIDTNSSVGLYLNNNVSHDIILANGGGRVGIGTTSPGWPLHVVESGPIFNAAIYAHHTATSGVNYGVFGRGNSSSGYGVYSGGNLGASGTKSFRIDHPEDPENKYLLHYATEGPEVINFYRGMVTLDAAGEAIVELPSYFGRINTSPSYQLTAVGAPMPNLHVAEEIDASTLSVGAQAGPGVAVPRCSFRIAGGAPGGKVSWRLEGVRNDPWVRGHAMEVEREKQGAERGKYQNPELYGRPPEMGVDYRPPVQVEPALLR